MVWMASPLRIRTPSSAPLPLPTMMAVGVASPRAQGQEITSTAMVAKMARLITGSSVVVQGKLKNSTTGIKKSGKSIHITKAELAIRITAGTK